MKKAVTCLLLIAIIIAAPLAVSAQSTTYTWAVDRKGNFVRTQDAYIPDRTITGLMLRDPEDIFIAPDGKLYICDTGNRRIIVYDTVLAVTERIIDSPLFQKPRGIYITAAMDLYVADSQAGAVFRFDGNDNLIQTFIRPDSPAFGDTAYAPMKVAVDGRGSVYIIGEGVYNGVIQLSVTGEFLGFFTTNRVTLTFVQMLQNIFFTDVQLQNLQDRVPGTMSNIYADGRGIIYTVSMGRHRDNLKKHNMRGSNMFSGGIIATDSFADVTTDKNGIIYAVDSRRGWIFVYSPDGSFIFDFGGSSNDDIAGLYSNLTAVAVEDNGTLWTLDYEKAYLQSYRPTEYTLSTYEAITLFNEGRYAEADAVWNNVLRHNQTSVLAHDGIGRAALYMQRYDEAMYHFELAGNRTYYSQAFWEVRNAWLQSNLIWLLLAVVILILFSLSLRIFDRQKKLAGAVGAGLRRFGNLRGVRDIAFAATVMRHPLDGYYDLKYKIKGSYGGATLLFLILFAATMLYQTSRAYILQTTAVEDINLTAIVAGFFGIVFLFITCNYLVTSINDGEGGLGDIYKMTAYATLPLTLSFLIITAISYVITFNEAFLVSFILTAGIAWFAVTLYMGLQEVHHYSVWNTVKSILFTAGFILIAVVALILLTVLFQQISQFFEAIGREVYQIVTGM